MTAGADRRTRAATGACAALVCAVVMVWGIGRPAVWTDEAATANAVRRSWGGVFALLHGRDAALVPYYMVAKFWYIVVGAVHAGDPWTVCRWLSALLACGCAGLLAGGLADRHRVTGLAAAAVLIALPGFARYAQEARPYCAMMLASTWSWLEWHRLATGRAGPGARYAASIVVLALVNPFALVQVVAQCAAAAARREQAIARIRVAMSTGVLVATPWIVWVAVHGRGPTSEHRRVTWSQVRTSASQLVAGPAFTSSWPLLLVVVVCLALAVVRVVSRRRTPEVAALLWALAAPVLLTIAGTVVQIALVPRYWLSSLPGIAIVVALSVDALAAGIVRRVVLVVLVAGVAVLGLGGQRDIRRPNGHGEDSRAAIAFVSTPQRRDLRVLFSRGGDALVIGEARPVLQRRFAGWDRSSGHNVSETAWPAERLRAALVGHRTALLLIRDTGVFRGTRTPTALRHVVAARLPALRAHGADPIAVQVVFQGGTWIVAVCTLSR